MLSSILIQSSFFIKHADTFVVAAIWCERIPIISAITSTVNLLLKSTSDSTTKSTLKNRFLVYLDTTDVKLFLWLFVPIIGNLVVFFYRRSCHHKQIGSEDKKLGSTEKYEVDPVLSDKSIALDAANQNVLDSTVKCEEDPVQVKQSIALDATTQNVWSVRDFPEFWNDREFMLPLMKREPRIIFYIINNSSSHAIFELLSHDDIAIDVVGTYGFFLSILTPEQRANKKIVLAAVRQDGWSVKHASDQLKGDRDVAIAATIQNPWAIQYLTAFWEDKKFILPLIKRDPHIIQYVSIRLRRDPDIIRRALETNGLCLKYLHPGDQDTPEWVEIAVRNNGLALQFAGTNCRGNEGLAFLANEQNKKASRYANIPIYWQYF